ncbi:MAG: helix-turn-helix transcriptional regulator [Clostridia bacterium]|nr:helix-turn-helix transcriptional regulator [Clostridia bacterium]
MLNDNIKILRKEKGLSQEELATKLNVVRQTVSKWENGLSVPDAEMLINIAKELDTTVSVLLDTKIKIDNDLDIKAIATNLESINNQLAKQKEARRKMRRIIFTVILVISIAILVGSIVNLIYYNTVMNNISANATIIGGYNGPTNVFVSSTSLRPLILIITLIFSAGSAFGLYKTRK